MRTKLILLIFLIGCLSCGTSNKPVSDAQKEKIIGEVKDLVNTFIKNGENANADNLELWYDSPDFVYINNGKTYNFKEFIDFSKTIFGTIINQKCTIVDEKYAVLDNSTVLYTTNCKWVANFKDGYSILKDPWAILLIIKKVDNKWKATYFTESGVKQNIKNAETSKELNQVELMKQWIGTWKWEVAKDTINYREYKPFGAGLECKYKYVTKGKIIREGRELLGYDKKVDKFVWFAINN